MLIILFIIGIGIMIWSCKSVKNYETEDPDDPNIGGLLLTIVAILLLSISGTSICIGLVNISKKNEINETISILENENNEMNNEIKTTVMSTLDSESELYKEFAKSNSTSTTMTLIFQYPELKSVNLVNNYIDIYRENQNEIKENKIKLAKLKTWKKIIYFGN